MTEPLGSAKSAGEPSGKKSFNSSEHYKVIVRKQSPSYCNLIKFKYSGPGGDGYK